MNNILDHSMFDRFSTQILPKIHTKIQWLELEPISIEHFLFAAEYPNLHCLTLSNIERQIDLCAFNGKKCHLSENLLWNSIRRRMIWYSEENCSMFRLSY